jgi:hypothetical protein
MVLFRELLSRDLANLEAAGIQLLCFQEVNPFWVNELQKLLPAWTLHYAASETRVVIAHHHQRWDRVETANLPCFPAEDEHNPHRGWRRFLQVSAGHYSLRSFA